VAPGHATGIAHIRDARTVGRIGVTALIHLEIVSTFAIGLGPVAGNLARPGAGFGGAMANAEANSYLLN
jgi:aerobic C4-dicarboxylate transport protein